MRPQAQGRPGSRLHQPLEKGLARSPPEPPEGASPAHSWSLGFRAPEQGEHESLLFEAVGARGTLRPLRPLAPHQVATGSSQSQELVFIWASCCLSTGHFPVAGPGGGGRDLGDVGGSLPQGLGRGWC